MLGVEQSDVVFAVYGKIGACRAAPSKVTADTLDGDADTKTVAVLGMWVTVDLLWGQVVF